MSEVITTEKRQAASDAVRTVATDNEAALGQSKCAVVRQTLSTLEYQAAVDDAMAELKELSSDNIIHFGAQAQEQLTAIAEQMLGGVKSKDTGPAGDKLSEMISVLRGFDTDKSDPSKKYSWWDRLLGRMQPLARFQQRYEAVNDQVETIAGALEKHKETLLHDIKSLDKLYDANLDYFQDLAFYIDAGEKKLTILDDGEIPTLAKIAKESNTILDVQHLKDLRARRDDLERRVHDLRLTRQVAMQSLPGIRMVQDNDKGLVAKINSTLVNTIPLWRQQLAQSMAIFRSHEAADTLQSATDLTNDLLEGNAAHLNQANAKARRQIERGVFDIETVKKANDNLIKTIEESLQISAEGKKARAEALKTLEQTESDLKSALRKAADQGQTGADIAP